MPMKPLKTIAFVPLSRLLILVVAATTAAKAQDVASRTRKLAWRLGRGAPKRTERAGLP
jgi:ureidoglycolate hydrolase